MKSIIPCFIDVTEINKLNRLAKLYNKCIDLHLVPNILVELDLVLQLLTVKENSSIENENTKKGLFCSVHNCVYFSTLVLDEQIYMFDYLDRATIVYLVENPRLQTFCPDVIPKLESYR